MVDDGTSPRQARWYWLVLASAGTCIVSMLLWWMDVKRQTELVPYMPIVREVDHGDHLLVDAPEVLTEAHVKAMATVLARYGEHYEVNGPALRIERKLAEDRDLLSNYTEKARAAGLGK